MREVHHRALPAQLIEGLSKGIPFRRVEEEVGTEDEVEVTASQGGVLLDGGSPVVLFHLKQRLFE